MKQLIIIFSIVLCIMNGFSQSTPNKCSQVDSIYDVFYTRYGYVDYYEYLKIPHGIGEEEFLSELDKFFRSIGVEKGYSAWQLHGFDHKRGTFHMVEFFHDLNQPINSNQVKKYSSEYLADPEAGAHRKKTKTHTK
jgi:hypothetical protein